MVMKENLHEECIAKENRSSDACDTEATPVTEASANVAGEAAAKMPDGGKKKVPKKEILRRILIVIFACVFVYCAVRLVITGIENIKARKSTEDVIKGLEGITRPSEPNIKPTTPIVNTTTGTETNKDPSETKPPKYSEYFLQCLELIRTTKEKYPDFIGYIEIDGLNIRYPILQSDDNTYYLEHLIDGTVNDRGEIFADFRNSENFLENFNTILYGHNLADETKFHNLIKYKDEENFKNCSIRIITEEGILTYEPFAFRKTATQDPYNKVAFPSQAAFAEYCNNQQALSMHPSKNFTFTGNERVITLSTCVSYFGGRWCLHAVLVDIQH